MNFKDMKKNATYVADSNSRHSAGACSLQIVNSECNGKRIKLSPALFKNLGEPSAVGVFLAKKSVCIYPDSEGITLSKGHIIYNGDLVKKVAEELELDFSVRTSISLPAVLDTDDEDKITFAVIKK